MPRVQLISRWYRLRHSLLILESIIGLLQRRSRLSALRAWAKRRRFAGPLRAYERQLDLVEDRLFHHQLHHPLLLVAAQFICLFGEALAGFFRPRYAYA